MMKFTFQKLFLFCSILIVFSSCVNEKKLIYFQKSNNNSDTILVAKAYVPKIQPGDILSIEIGSLNDQASSFFNPFSGGGENAGTTNSSGDAGNTNTSPALSKAASPEYLVDSSGEIEVRLIGNIKVRGYTTSQLKDTLKSRLKLYLYGPTVIVRLLNFKISILGEVSKPGVYNIPNEMITLPEAISMAGDLTLYGRRDSVEIIRDVNGKKVIGAVNFNKRDLFNSPYYYLHTNDLIYVKPAKTKADQTDKSIQYISIGATLISLILLIFKK